MNERRSSLRIPPRDSISKRNTRTQSDSDLVVKYIDKLNEVIEEKKILENKIKDKEQMMLNMQKNPKKFIKNIYCDKCNIHQMEIEDYLNELLLLKKKYVKFKKEKNKKIERLTKYENLYITREYIFEFNKEKQKYNKQLNIFNNISFQFQAISII